VVGLQVQIVPGHLLCCSDGKRFRVIHHGSISCSTGQEGVKWTSGSRVLDATQRNWSKWTFALCQTLFRERILQPRLFCSAFLAVYYMSGRILLVFDKLTGRTASTLACREQWASPLESMGVARWLKALIDILTLPAGRRHSNIATHVFTINSH
jgi:hypothetical protein